jgi:hypothetical protein
MGEVKGHDQIDVKISFKESGHKPEGIIAPRNRIGATVRPVWLMDGCVRLVKR